MQTGPDPSASQNSLEPGMTPARRRRNRVIVTLIFLVAAVFFFGGGMLIRSKLAGPQKRMAERKQRVMYDVDHLAVLEACRFVHDHRTEFRPDPKLESTGPDAVNPDATDPKMPAVIRDLDPTYVLASDKEVRIEMGDDIYHFGLTYSDEPTKYSMQPLIPHLWFYTQDGVVPDRIR